MSPRRPHREPSEGRFVPEPESADFWARMRDGELVVQECDSCGHRQYPPLPFCESCRSSALGWTRSAGAGRILAATVVHHAPHPLLAHEVPFTLAMVLLDEGVRMCARVDLAQDEDPVGCRAHAVFPADGVVRFALDR